MKKKNTIVQIPGLSYRHGRCGMYSAVLSDGDENEREMARAAVFGGGYPPKRPRWHLRRRPSAWCFTCKAWRPVTEFRWAVAQQETLETSADSEFPDDIEVKVRQFWEDRGPLPFAPKGVDLSKLFPTPGSDSSRIAPSAAASPPSSSA